MWDIQETALLLYAQQERYDAEQTDIMTQLHAGKSGLHGWCVGKHAWSHWPSSCAAVAGGCWGWEGAVQGGAPEGGCLSAPGSACCSPTTGTPHSGNCHLLANLQIQQHTSLQDPNCKIATDTMRSCNCTSVARPHVQQFSCKCTVTTAVVTAEPQLQGQTEQARLWHQGYC